MILKETPAIPEGVFHCHLMENLIQCMQYVFTR